MSISKRVMALLTMTLLTATTIFATAGGGHDHDDHITVLRMTEDRPIMEFLGQFINTSTSLQYGYLSNIQGLTSTFTGLPANESKAMFTVVNSATTALVAGGGATTSSPFRVVERIGTTTIYFNVAGGADFTNPESFAAGIPIQVSEYHQLVFNDVATGNFSTVHTNTITSVTPFTLNGAQYQLGRVGDTFRTTFIGKVNPAATAPPTGASPSGWFTGYAVGTDRKHHGD
jgi:hypothetical protein